MSESVEIKTLEEVTKGAKRKNWLIRIIIILGVILLVSAVAIASVTIYFQNYYEAFWVNGQSMYPTLNKNAKYADGTLVGSYRSRGQQDGMYDIDYGFLDTHAETLKNLKRFDIVTCTYKTSSISQNIKRLIVMPGEKFYIASTSFDLTLDPKDNGKLYIWSAEKKEFEYVAQTFITDQEVYSGNYPEKYADKDHPTTLTAEQYFVMGDNRPSGHSLDSRSDQVGFVTKDSIIGKACGLYAKCKVGYDAKGTYAPKSISYYFPRFF